LNAGTIAKVAIEQGLWSPEGQTPARQRFLINKIVFQMFLDKL